MVHDNEVIFEFSNGANKEIITFKWKDEPDQYCITDGQEFKGVEVKPQLGKVVIKITAGRKHSEDVAKCFNRQVTTEGGMVHTSSFGPSRPIDMNFWIKGSLIIHDDRYEIWIGQTGAGQTNYWYLGSMALTSPYPQKLGEKYYVSPEGHYTFLIKPISVQGS